MNVKDVLPKTAESVTEETINAWKKANPSGVFELSAKDKKAWVRKPTRNELKMISAKAKSSDPITLSEIILETIWLGGDEEIQTDDDLFLSVMPAVQNIMDVEEGLLKKL